MGAGKALVDVCRCAESSDDHAHCNHLGACCHCSCLGAGPFTSVYDRPAYRPRRRLGRVESLLRYWLHWRQQ